MKLDIMTYRLTADYILKVMLNIDIHSKGTVKLNFRSFTMLAELSEIQQKCVISQMGDPVFQIEDLVS